MNLRDGVQRVRRIMREGNPWLYTNADIIRDLNLSANMLISGAQGNTSTYRGLTKAPGLDAAGQPVGFQEYELPLNVDTVTGVKVQIGTLYPITFFQQADLQLGQYVSSLPLSAYIRRSSGALVSQVPSTNNIDGGEVINPPSDPASPSRWVIGFYPIPQQVYQFFVDHTTFHPVMSKPQDEVLLPPRSDFMDAWVAYSQAQCSLVMGDTASYQTYMQIHNNGVGLLAQYYLNQQWQINPPVYGGQDMNQMQPTDITTIATTNPRVFYD